MISGTLDCCVLAAAAFGWAVFFASHVVLLRRFTADAGKAFLGGFALGLAGVAGFWFFAPFSDAELMAGGIMSVILFGLFFLHFTSLIFGVGESAVRFRILRELELRGEGGLTLSELYARYNTQAMLRIRLARLTAGGQLRVENGLYRAGDCRVLLLQIRFMDLLKRLLPE